MVCHPKELGIIVRAAVEMVPKEITADRFFRKINGFGSHQFWKIGTDRSLGASWRKANR